MLRGLLLWGAAAGVCMVVACSSDPKSQASAASSSGGTSSSSSGSSGQPGSSSSSSGSSGTPSPDGGTPATGDGISDKVTVTNNVAIQVAGTARQYSLAVPKDYDAGKAYPLIIALHGDGQTASDFVAFSKMTLASTDQAIVAFPDQVLDLFTDYDDNPDQQLVEATIDDVKKSKNIDAHKVWGFGYSKGAFMLNEFGCRKPAFFNAMASHAGGAPQEQDNNGNVQCPNAAALPWFITMGSADDPGGGEFEAQYWAGLAGCGQDMSPTTPTICQKYNGCNTADPVVYCTVPNQPHYPLYDNAAIDSWNWFMTLP